MNLRKHTILLTGLFASFGWSQVALADEGIRATGSDSGVIYFQDDNYSGSWNYICYNDICDEGTLVNGYWERSVTGLVDGTSYDIEAKVQDDTVGQFLSGKIAAAFDASKTTGGSVTSTGTETDSSTDSTTDSGSDTSTDNSVATNTYYLVHKATGKKASTCGPIGSAVNMVDESSLDTCAQWEQVPNGDYFYLRSVAADGYIRPRGLSNGIPILVQPTSWDGNYTQWSFNETGDGYGHLVNRQTSKFAYSSGETLLQQSKRWTGDWSRWKLVAASNDTDTNSDTNTDSDTATNTDTGSDTATDTNTNSDTDTNSNTDTLSDTDTDTGLCGAPDVDYAADHGEGYVAGLTSTGLAFYREQSNASRGFAVWGPQGTGPNLAGQTKVYTEQNGTTYHRYEYQIENFDSNATYTLEMRLQGNECGTGQSIHNFNITAGDGLFDAQCYIPGSSGPVEPVGPDQTVAMRVTNGSSGQARLIAGKAFGDKEGFALYTFQNDSANVSNCEGTCEDFWPKVIIASPDDLLGAGGVTGEFGTISRTRTITDECGDSVEVTDYHVTYNNKPLYFYRDDTSPETTAGASIARWDLAEANLIEQLPLVKYPHKSLLAAVNGLEPNNFGYAIDIEGRTLTWRPSGYNNNQSGLIQQFSPWGGNGQPVSPKDPNLQLWCSNNQIQFHMIDMPGTITGPYKAEIPGACYGKFYYFLRYRIYGTVNNQPEDNWVYTALYHYDETKPGERFDPRTRPTVTYTSANWQRIGHPHSRDRVEEAILHDAAPYNNTPVSGLERYTTTFVDGPNTFNIQPNASVAPMRIEAFEWGAGNCQGPQYMINAGNQMAAGRFDYGQIISWEATFGGSNNSKYGGTSISSQVYNTMQNTTVGLGFSSATGDPRLNLVDQYGVRMVHSDGCNPVEKEERNARFAQQLTSIQDADQVNDFVVGHNDAHGLPAVTGARVGDTGLPGSKPVVTTSGKELSAGGMGSCGTCHFRDGRSSDVFETPKGQLMGLPIYGSGLLSYIKDREVGLTWDGSQASVQSQAKAALKNDLDLTPGDIGQEVFDRIVVYVETLHVPVREYSTYKTPDNDASLGEIAFHENGCADCHTATQKTESSAPVWARDIVIRPYTDMAMWDVGTGKSLRTPPLWGIGENIKMLKRNGKDTIFMHDGRANSLTGAIDAHGNGSVNGLSASDKSLIVKFLETL